ncbi:nitroreductase family protein [Lysobacter sp. A289]
MKSVIVARFKDMFRPGRDIVFALVGFIYDFQRFARYGGWFGFDKTGKVSYKVVKIYHRLEKSLSFRNRRAGAGVTAAEDLVRFLQKYGVADTDRGFQELVSLKVLSDFVAELPQADEKFSSVVEFSQQNCPKPGLPGGVMEKTASFLTTGKLDEPEKFFFTRYSVRDFSSKRVEFGVVERAIELAMKSPSVCSRQAWHVYYSESRETIDKTLAYQNGSKGFGHEVPGLFIVCVDLNAFDTAGERYQHWIDGGMFAMSLIWALHSLGVSSCCLNWSKGVRDDIALRRATNIKGEHTITTLLAVGYANEHLRVCQSARRPVSDILTILE